MQCRLKGVIRIQATEKSPKTLRNRNKPANDVKIATGELFFLLSKHIYLYQSLQPVCVRGGRVKSTPVIWVLMWKLC